MFAERQRMHGYGGGDKSFARQAPGHGSNGQSSTRQPAHSLAACTRCRGRKSKCDPRLPRCGPCERADLDCNYYDQSKDMIMSRSYVIELESQVKELEAELAQLRVETEYSVPVEEIIRGGGLVKIKRNAESRFLGPSSGIHMTKLVMEFARSFAKTKTISEIIPKDMAEQIRSKFEEEHAKPTSKIYPLTSNIPSPNLPPLNVTHQLMKEFMIKAQTFYPVLHEPTFRQDVQDVYNGSTIPYQNFVVRMVIALSMHKVDSRWAGLADSFYLAALQYLEGTIRPRNLGTLQCFALIAEYSITTPTRTASYWIVGLAAKLLQEMRMTDEATIGCDEHGNPLDPLEIDMRRRLFYVCTNMELGLAHSLGRPSAFSVTYDHNDIGLYSEVDDEHITRSGIDSNAPPSFRKQMSIHYNKMRWVQLEIRHTLYLNKRDFPENDQHYWFLQMEKKVEHWMHDYPKPADGNGFPEEWFRLRYNTIVMFLFRPSPQIPKPSMRAVRRCFEAAVDNIHIQHRQVEKGSVDVTWVFAQQLFLAMNMTLWTLSYSELRREHTKESVAAELQTGLVSIWKASQKWPGAESALSLYSVLSDYCLKAYDGEAQISYGAASPLSQPLQGPTSPQSTSHSADTSQLLSSPSTAYSFLAPSTAGKSTTSSWMPTQSESMPYMAHSDGGATDQGLTPGNSVPAASPAFSGASFDPNSFYNPLPGPQIDFASDIFKTTNYVLDPAMEPYMPFMVFQQDEPMEGINSEQQSMLMAHLEKYGLGSPPDMSCPRHNIVD